MLDEKDNAGTKTNPEAMGAYRPGKGSGGKRPSPERFDEDDLLAMNPDLMDLDAISPETIGGLPASYPPNART
jgi:hypothetical protein